MNMTDQELDEAYIDLPESEQEEMYGEAVDYLLDSKYFCKAPDWGKDRMIKIKIRSMMRERLGSNEPDRSG